MPEDFELQDLSRQKYFTSPSEVNSVSMSEVSYGAVWVWTSAIILSLLSLTLMSPRFLLFIAGETRLEPTSLEAFLSLNLGVLLAAITVSLILNIPSSDPLPSKSVKLQRHPELIPLTAGGLVMSFLCYNTANLGYLSTLFSCLTGTIGLCGLWTMMFGGYTSYRRR